MSAGLTMDSRSYRDALAQVPSGVVALCATVEDQPVAMVVSSFTVGISETPPLALFAAQKSSSTWPDLRRAERIGVSLFAQEHAALCRQMTSADRAARFAGVPVVGGPGGAIFVAGSPLWLTCSIESVSDAGDHDLVLLHVEEYVHHPDPRPLVFQRSRFHQLHPHVTAPSGEETS